MKRKLGIYLTLIKLILLGWNLDVLIGFIRASQGKPILADIYRHRVYQQLGAGFYFTWAKAQQENKL